MKLAFGFGLRGLQVPMGQAVPGSLFLQHSIWTLCHPELMVCSLNGHVYVISCVFFGCLK